jgi:hypothetical protein
MKLAFLLLFSLFAAHSSWTVAHDTASGLTIHYPKDWRRDTAPQNFTIVNFPEKDTPPQVLIPMNKASIMVAAPPVKSQNIPSPPAILAPASSPLTDISMRSICSIAANSNATSTWPFIHA